MRRVGPVMSTPFFRRAGAAVLGAFLAVGGTALTAPAAAAPPERVAVIVTLAPGSDAAAEARRAAGSGGSVAHVYRDVFRGFAATLPTSAVAALQRNPRVVTVEADGPVRTAASQTSATWGLDRIDQRTRTLNRTYNYPATGSGVRAYVVDSGVAVHDEFDQRADGYDVFGAPGNGWTDCNGHGTHVAGTVAGNLYGAAKGATVVPVRVLDCAGSGSLSGVIAGLDWIVKDHVSGPAVANLSLGGGRNSTLDSAVGKVISDGVTVAVAAGNSNIDACNTSPARVSGALTTGATDSTDRRASFSNYGSCLDLFAPGVAITSAWSAPGSTAATSTISGTSMASPHVAGAAAVLLEQRPTLSPSAVATELVRASTKKVVSSKGSSSPNRLLAVVAYGGTLP
ncbi:MAG: S8 family peptidase [Actinomycetota bacterium]|nr:S8 family peptidase [Actinomycetota bacterium]